MKNFGNAVNASDFPGSASGGCLVRVHDALAGANQVAIRVECLRDALLGAMPSNAVRDGATPDGALNALAYAAANTADILAGANKALDELYDAFNV